MEHISVFIYVCSLLLGISSIAMMMNLNRRRRWKFIQWYIVFIATINLGAMMQMVMTYLSVNISDNAVMNDFPGIRLWFVFVSYFNSGINLFSYLCAVCHLLKRRVPKPALIILSIFLFVFLVMYGSTIPQYLQDIVVPLSVVHASYFYFQIASLFIPTLVLMIFSSKIKERYFRNTCILFSTTYIFIYLLLIASTIFPLTKNNITITPAFLLSNVIPLYMYKRMKGVPLETDLSLLTDGDATGILQKHKISEREREVIKLLIMGKTNREIENELFISPHTVKNHIYNIFRKLNIKNRSQLGSLFYKNNTHGL